jgi:DGQHR domain-containing protein
MSQPLSYKIPVMRIKQREDKGQAMYIGVVKAADFLNRPNERFVIDYFKRDNKVDYGYQRQLSKPAVEKIKKYILSETGHPLLPTALLLNSRSELKFDEFKAPFGFLNIEDVLHIIDGQHRFEAWSSMMQEIPLRNKLGDFEFPVVILTGFDITKEIEQFFVVNSRQKRIKTDLAQRNFLHLATHKDTKGLIPENARWQLYATKIVDYLNEKEDSVWKDKIILPDDGPDLRKAKVISQNSFVTSLQPLFTGSKSIFSTSEESEIPLDEWAKFISDYWKLIGRIYPDAIHNHPYDYSLMKTVGTSSLHLLLARVCDDISGEKGIASKEDREKVLKELEKAIRKVADKDFKLAFWRSKATEDARRKGINAGSYSSSVGHRTIVSKIMWSL